MRVYCEDYENFLTEYCTDDDGENWRVGKKFTPGTN